MSDAAAIVAARLKELWRANRPTIAQRMTALHDALDSLRRNPADAEARTKGREAAHKLSGVLGVFGLPQGSEIASEIEAILIDQGQPSEPAGINAEAQQTLREQIAQLDTIIASKPAGE